MGKPERSASPSKAPCALQARSEQLLGTLLREGPWFLRATAQRGGRAGDRLAQPPARSAALAQPPTPRPELPRRRTRASACRLSHLKTRDVDTKGRHVHQTGTRRESFALLLT